MATKSQPVKRSAEYVKITCRIPQGLNIRVLNEAGSVVLEQFLHGSTSAYAVAGHGMTSVKTATWDAIVAHFKDKPNARWLHNESVFVSGDDKSAQAKAAERKDLDVGYNPIDPNNPSERVRTGVAIQVEGSRDPGEGA